MASIAKDPGGKKRILFVNPDALRPTFLKTIDRAGLDPWPRLFQNLRAAGRDESAAQNAAQSGHEMGSNTLQGKSENPINPEGYASMRGRTDGRIKRLPP